MPEAACARSEASSAFPAGVLAVVARFLALSSLPFLLRLDPILALAECALLHAAIALALGASAAAVRGGRRAHRRRHGVAVVRAQAKVVLLRLAAVA